MAMRKAVRILKAEHSKLAYDSDREVVLALALDTLIEDGEAWAEAHLLQNDEHALADRIWGPRCPECGKAAKRQKWPNGSPVPAQPDGYCSYDVRKSGRAGSVTSFWCRNKKEVA